MDKIYSRSFFVSANESNPEGELAVNILVSSIIEIATAHANELGIGNPSMDHLGAGWVLSRLSIEMTRYPKVNTPYTILTWVEGWNRHFSVRDFEIIDGNGVTVGYAKSVWMVLNTKTHENFGLSHLSLPEEMISDRCCPVASQGRHIEILPYSDSAEHSEKNLLIANLPDRTYTFQYNDIDFYRHVNTVRYVTLLLNCYTLDQFDRNYLSRLELSFLHEGNFGETVDIRRYEAESNPGEQDSRLTSFSLVSQTKQMPILFARIELKTR